MSSLKANASLLAISIPCYLMAVLVIAIPLASLADMLIPFGAKGGKGSYLSQLIAFNAASYVAGYPVLSFALKKQPTANGWVAFYVFLGLFVLLQVLSIAASYPLSMLFLSLCVHGMALYGFYRVIKKKPFAF